MCAVVCPFDVLTFYPLAEGPTPEVAVAVKCDGCIDRVSRGDTPACVEVCKVDALVFGELNELVAAGRVRETAAILAAAGATPTVVPGGDPLAGWHAWGTAEAAAASDAAARARHVNGERSRRGCPFGGSPERRRATMTSTNGRARSLTVNQDAQVMIDRAKDEGITTVWDRLADQQPQCGYCALGLSCRNCAMGPCRIDPFGEGPQKGVCGADADVIVARNLGRTIAAGSSSHSDHGRDILEAFGHLARGETMGYRIADEEKLRRIAAEVGVVGDGRTAEEVAGDLADVLQEDYGTRRGSLSFVARVPEVRRDKWQALGITPRGIDRENVEMLHRTHMGVDNDYVNTLLHALRTGLSDGWGGSMIATELSDVMFGTPKPVMSEVNLGVLKTDQVNIAMHGHNPLLSDVICAAAEAPELVELARSVGAKGINIVGLCCTGNELLMRRGIPMAGNHLMQELVLITGALEAMVVDYQCIMPSIVDVAKCYHTKVISTSDKAKFTGATHVPFDPEHGAEVADRIVRMAIEAYPDRNHGRVRIPGQPVKMMGGFSVEAILGALGGTPKPLVDAIVAGSIRARWPWSAATIPSSPRTSST